MAFSMPPPSLGGFSLRVQLFSPTAHSLSDKPIRAFRVVTSPEVTIREFCQEASRIHQINYGEPIAIKKCQDDQEFDVTQTETVGILFANTATIRVIQASASPSIRDSVPPNSALRYDPGVNINGKRDRGASPQTNGDHAHPSTNAWNPNKRQRVSDPDPDQPLPSLEEESDSGSAVKRTRIVPESHGSNAFARSNGASRDVRAVIEETPPPEFPQNHSTDQWSHKSPYAKLQNLPETGRTSPGAGSARSQSNPARAKSASYHIQRATERGTSVSTAATSPLSGEQLSMQGTTTKRNVSSSFVDGKTRSPNEDSIYENIESDSEGPTTNLKKAKASLKIRNSPQNGLPGLEWASKFNTPPNGTRRNSRPREQPPSELPLTPSSRERQEKQRQRQEADDAREARKAAAEAAEQRQREADAARELEEAQAAETARILAEEEERNAMAKKAAIIEKAAKLEREREEKNRLRLEKLENERLEKERVEESRREQARLKKEREAAARLEREKKAQIERERKEAERKEAERKEAERKEAERIEQERVQALEVEKRRAQEEREQAEAEEEELRREKEYAAALKTNKSSVSVEPMDAKATPLKQTPSRPQSSTPFIPTGRKPLKSSLSSRSSSSPVLTRTSPSGSPVITGAVVNGSAKRKVSFDLDVDSKPRHDTPIRPGAILPGMRPASTVSTPKVSTPVPSKAPSKPASNTTKVTPVPPPKTTRILPPQPIARLTKERTATPQRQSPAPAIKPTVNASKIIPQVVIKSGSPAILPPSRKSATPSVTAETKENFKSTESEPVIISSEESSDEEDEEDNEEDAEEKTPVPSKSKPVEPEVVVSSDDESDEDIPSRIDPVKLLNAHSLRKNQSIAPIIKSEPKVADEEEEEDVEVASDRSSSPESRSPVIFNQKSTSSIPDLHPLPEAAQAIDDEETQSDNESSTSEEEEAQQSSEEEGESEYEEVSAKTAVQIPKSSPELPRSHSASKPATPAPARPSSQTQKLRKPVSISPPRSPTDSESNTQDEVDFQLTSSLYEAQPPSSQSASAKTNTILPPTSSHSQPRFGASLQAMNSQKPTFTAINVPKPALAVAQKFALPEESEEETEDDDSSSDSDGEMENARVEGVAAMRKLGSQAETQSQDERQSARGANGRVASKGLGLSQSRKAGKEFREFKGKKDSQLLHGYSFGKPTL